MDSCIVQCSSVCSQRSLKESLQMLHVAFGPREQCCPRGSPNTIDWMSPTKVGRKVQPSQVFSRNSPFDPRSALPPQSRWVRQQHVFLLRNVTFLRHANENFLVWPGEEQHVDSWMWSTILKCKSVNVYSQKLVKAFLCGRTLFSTRLILKNLWGHLFHYNCEV